MKGNKAELREALWPLMPVDRCYGESDIWCEDCRKALSKITSLIDSYATERVIKELKNANNYDSEWKGVMIRDRIRTLEQSITDKEK